MGPRKAQVVFHAQSRTLCHCCHRWFKSHSELVTGGKAVALSLQAAPGKQDLILSAAPALMFMEQEPAFPFPQMPVNQDAPPRPSLFLQVLSSHMETDPETCIHRHAGTHAHTRYRHVHTDMYTCAHFLQLLSSHMGTDTETCITRVRRQADMRV